MCLDELPEELLFKIFHNLMSVGEDFIELSLVTKRINEVSKLITKHPEWIKYRPVVCHIIIPQKNIKITNSEDISDIFNLLCSSVYLSENHNQNDHDCIQPGLMSIIHGKYINFSSIKIKNVKSFRGGCFNIEDSMNKINQPSYNPNDVLIYPSFTSYRTDAVVEIELSSCSISLNWLSDLLSIFPRVKYLTLTNVSFRKGAYLAFNSDFTRELIRLKIFDPKMKINDANFKYFSEKIPAAELVLSGSKILFDLDFVKFHYKNTLHCSKLLGYKGSFEIFSFMAIGKYLIKNRMTTKFLCLDNTNVNVKVLDYLLSLENLGELQIQAKNCPNLHLNPSTIPDLKRKFNSLDKERIIMS